MSDSPEPYDSSFDDALVECVTSALSRFLAEQGSFMDGFVGMVQFHREDGRFSYAYFAPGDQFHNTSVAMADQLNEWHRMIRSHNMHEDLMGLGDDDDE